MAKTRKNEIACNNLKSTGRRKRFTTTLSSSSACEGLTTLKDISTGTDLSVLIVAETPFSGPNPAVCSAKKGYKLVALGTSYYDGGK